MYDKVQIWAAQEIKNGYKDIAIEQRSRQLECLSEAMLCLL